MTHRCSTVRHEDRYLQFPKYFLGLVYDGPTVQDRGSFRLDIDRKSPKNQKKCLNGIFQEEEEEEGENIAIPNELSKLYFDNAVRLFKNTDSDFVLSYIKRLHSDLGMVFDWTFLSRKSDSESVDWNLLESINEFILAAGIIEPNQVLQRDLAFHTNSSGGPRTYPPFIAIIKDLENFWLFSSQRWSDLSEPFKSLYVSCCINLEQHLYDLRLYKSAGCDPNYVPDWCTWYRFDQFLDGMLNLVDAEHKYCREEVLFASLDFTITGDDLNSDGEKLNSTEANCAMLRYLLTVCSEIVDSKAIIEKCEALIV